MGPRACLNRCRISRYHRESSPGPSNPVTCRYTTLAIMAYGTIRFLFFICLAQEPNAGQGLEVSRLHTMTHHSRYVSSGREVGPSQRPLPGNTHSAHNRHTSMPLKEVEPANLASKRPQTLAPDRSATETDGTICCSSYNDANYNTVGVKLSLCYKLFFIQNYF